MAYIFIALGVLFRLIPHAPNFVPIAAMALFGGAYLNKKYALILPLAIMFISDIFLGFHQTMFWVYGSFVIIGLIGMWLQNHKSAKNTVLASLAGSVIFFVVTNFGVWLGPWYQHDFAGLVRCFTMAIPFFRNTLLGDLFYTGVFFGGYELVKSALKRLSYRELTI